MKLRLVPNSITSIALMFAIFAFAFLGLRQYVRIDPERSLQQLIETKKVNLIGPWVAFFYKCEVAKERKNCTVLSETKSILRLGLDFELSNFIKENFPQANVVELEYLLKRKDRQFLEKHPSVNFVMPKMVHSDTVATLNGSEYHRFRGILAPLILPVANVSQSAKISLSVNFESLRVFGPTDMKAALVDSNYTSDFINISALQKTTFELNRLIEIVLPALLGSVSLVFDHAPSLGLVAFYSIFRSIHAYLFAHIETIANLPYQAILLLFYFLQSVILMVFIATIIKMSRFAKLKSKWFALSTSIVSITVTSASFTINPGIERNLIALDMLGSFIGFFIVLAAFFRNRKVQWRRLREFDLNSDFSSNRTFYHARLLFLGVGILFFGAMRFDSFSTIAPDGRDLAFQPLSAYAMLPVFVFCIFLEMGSTVKWMQKLISNVKRKAQSERELSLGKQLQQRLLPNKKSNIGKYHYRILFWTPNAIADSYHDIAPVFFLQNNSDDKNGRFLCMIQASFSEQGIRAALISNIVASHWGLWKKSLSSQPAASNEKLLATYLRDACMRIKEGISVLNIDENIVLTAILLDCEQNHFAYATFGSMPILLGNSRETNIRSISSRSLKIFSQSRLENLRCEVGRFEATEDTLAILSLSVCPLRQLPEHFATSLSQENKNITTQCLSSFRSSVKAARSLRETEQDRFFLVLQKEK